MKSPILIITLAFAVCSLSAFSKSKHKAKHKTKPKHSVAVKHHAAAVVIPADKSVASFSLLFAGGKSWQSFVSTDVHCTYGINGYFNMVANFKSGEKFDVSYIASDKIPTPRYQLKRMHDTPTKYYIRFTQRNHSELYFSGYDLNFINAKGAITADIKLLTAEHNTMQSLHIRLLKK